MATYVCAVGPTLVLGSVPFRFAGANCYLLLTHSAGEDTRDEVLEVLDAAVRMHCTVLRTWAFNDGCGWRALQSAPGVYNPVVFAGFDWLLTQCRMRGLRLILTLTNYWPDFGGMQQYVSWSQGRPVKEVCPDSFYTDPTAQCMFVSYMRSLVMRTNTLTGLMYCDDPTILGWELANEPRCPSDPSGLTLQAWICATAAALRSLDRNHLIGIGAEGFFGASTPDLQQFNPPGSSGHGEDWVRDAQDPNIDFASMHLYPESWLPVSPVTNAGGQALEFAEHWVTVHGEVARAVLQKPLILGEFAATAKGCGCSRSSFFKQVYTHCLRHAAGDGPLAGAMFWMLAPHTYPDYDKFTLHCATCSLENDKQRSVLERVQEGTTVPGDDDDAGALAAVATFGQDMMVLSGTVSNTCSSTAGGVIEVATVSSGRQAGKVQGPTGAAAMADTASCKDQSRHWSIRLAACIGSMLACSRLRPHT